MWRSARIIHGLDVITSVLINKRSGQEGRSLPLMALKMKKRSHDPRKVGGLSKVKKARK